MSTATKHLCCVFLLENARMPICYDMNDNNTLLLSVFCCSLFYGILLKHDHMFIFKRLEVISNPWLVKLVAMDLHRHDKTAFGQSLLSITASNLATFERNTN